MPLENKYLEEFIAGIKRLTERPRPQQSSYPSDKDYVYALKSFLIEDSVYCHVLDEIKKLGILRDNSLSAEKLNSIMKSFKLGEGFRPAILDDVPGQVISFVSALKDAGAKSAQVMASDDFATDFPIMAARLTINRDFSDCAAVQENKVQEYVNTELPWNFQGREPFIGNWGREYLSLSQELSARPKNVLDPLTRARIARRKVIFEGEVRAANPAMEQGQLTLKYQDELQKISKEFNLPMPSALNFG